MATCESLQHIFDNILPENPTLLESLLFNKIKPVKSIESSSFTEIFGELHFKESSPHISSTEENHTKFNQNKEFESADITQTPSSASFSITQITSHNNRHKSSDSVSWLNSESMHLCTEGLGFESSDDVEDSKSGMNEYWQVDRNEKEGVNQHLSSRDHSYGECRRSRVNEYPPPISSIRRTGKPWVYFRSYRNNGRFVLEEVRIPTQELLRAYREDGRLKLQFVHPPDDEFLEEEDEEENCIGSIDEEGEDMAKEEDDCITRHPNEEKEIA